jgi:hypothetical protein
MGPGRAMSRNIGVPPNTTVLLQSLIIVFFDELLPTEIDLNGGLNCLKFKHVSQ